MEDPIIQNNNPADADDANEYDDFNQNTHDDDQEQRNVATPEQQQREESPRERAERAAAAAEVAVMDTSGTARRTQRNPQADAALMGATALTQDAVAPVQTLDESGELVRQAFVEFLQN